MHKMYDHYVAYIHEFNVLRSRYLPLAQADSASGDQAPGEEEDDVDVARCEPVYSSATGAAALQLSLHMNWARCLKELKQPNDGQYFVRPHCLAAPNGCIGASCYPISCCVSKLAISNEKLLARCIRTADRSKACKCCSGVGRGRQSAHGPRQQRPNRWHNAGGGADR